MLGRNTNRQRSRLGFSVSATCRIAIRSSSDRVTISIVGQRHRLGVQLGRRGQPALQARQRGTGVRRGAPMLDHPVAARASTPDQVGQLEVVGVRRRVAEPHVVQRGQRRRVPPAQRLQPGQLGRRRGGPLGRPGHLLPGRGQLLLVPGLAPAGRGPAGAAASRRPPTWPRKQQHARPRRGRRAASGRCRRPRPPARRRWRPARRSLRPRWSSAASRKSIQLSRPSCCAPSGPSGVQETRSLTLRSAVPKLRVGIRSTHRARASRTRVGSRVGAA